MTTESDLLREICLDPADDGPRLVYADWLDESGDPERAEFIRWSISPRKEPRVIGWGCSCPSGRPPCHECVQLTEERLHEYHEQRRQHSEWQDSKLRSERFNHGFSIPGVQVKVSRGFPSEIRCTVREFLGGDCPKCYVRIVNGKTERVGCMNCDFTKKVKGLAKKIAGKWPVEKVVLDVCQPHYLHSNGWRWWCQVTNRHGSDVIPELIWNKLSGFIMFGGGDPFLLKWYSTREEALSALSNACVDYIRSLIVTPEIAHAI